MAVTVTMPELGESVTEGTVTRWLKDTGDTVELDEPHEVAWPAAGQRGIGVRQRGRAP